jgi:hypothetical protein|tara:strand:- start:568 stop:792 length:225 start_codon:yes stop_codon:yes gene_type:complete
MTTTTTTVYSVTSITSLNMAGGSRTYEQDAGDFFTREEADRVASACGGNVTEWRATSEALDQLEFEGSLGPLGR